MQSEARGKTRRLIKAHFLKEKKSMGSNGTFQKRQVDFEKSRIISLFRWLKIT